MKLYLTLLLLWAAVLCGRPASVTLQWDPNPEPDIAGYRIYWRTNGGTYTTNRMVAVTNGVTGTVSNLAFGTTYLFVCTAYNTTNLESDYSNEVTAAIPVVPRPPNGLRVKTILQTSTTVGPANWVDIADLGERTFEIEDPPPDLFVRARLEYERVEIAPPVLASRAAALPPPIPKR